MISECEACGAGTEHQKSCIRDFTPDKSCLCTVTELKTLDFHGRKMILCESCYSKEEALLKASHKNLHEYQKNIPDKIENKVEEAMKGYATIERWQDLYVTERAQWILANFESVEDMRDKLHDFILSMEKLQWETKAKKRVAFEAAKELDARMTREQREALINDPNFKPATNSEFKKLAKEREVDEAVKTLDIPGATAAQRKAIASLAAMGISAEDIKKTLKIKEKAL